MLPSTCHSHRSPATAVFECGRADNCVTRRAQRLKRLPVPTLEMVDGYVLDSDGDDDDVEPGSDAQRLLTAMSATPANRFSARLEAVGRVRMEEAYGVAEPIRVAMARPFLQSGTATCPRWVCVCVRARAFGGCTHRKRCKRSCRAAWNTRCAARA